MDGSETVDRDAPRERLPDRTVGGRARSGDGRDRRPVLPEQSRDDTDRGWGDQPDSNDDRLLAERPPHW